MIRRVTLGRLAEKQLRRIPRHVAAKLLEWVDSVGHEGLEETRRLRGFHDEPLHGDREGQRSIRLSRSYRAIYVIAQIDGRVFARVQEIHKHEY